MLDASALPAVLRRLPRIRIEGVFWRTVPNHYLAGPPPGAPAGSRPEPLWSGGAAIHGARYTRRGGARMLYLAPNAATALAEVRAVLFDDDGRVAAGPAHDPLLVLAVDVVAPAILDLCDSDVQRALETSSAELTKPWLRAQARFIAGRDAVPPTQALGESAAETRTILGLRYPSARHAGEKNLVIFTDRITALGGRIGVIDQSGTHSQSLP